MSLEADKQECEEAIEKLKNNLAQAQHVLNESQKGLLHFTGRLEQINIQLKRNKQKKQTKK